MKFLQKKTFVKNLRTPHSQQIDNADDSSGDDDEDKRVSTHQSYPVQVLHLDREEINSQMQAKRVETLFYIYPIKSRFIQGHQVQSVYLSHFFQPIVRCRLCNLSQSRSNASFATSI